MRVLVEKRHRFLMTAPQPRRQIAQQPRCQLNRITGHQRIKNKIPSTTRAEELTSKPSEAAVDSSPAAASPTISPAKDALKVTLRFTQMLMKKLPEIVDGNPVKVALGLAKAIIQIKDVCAQNMDAVERRIASTGAQLAILEKALDDPRTYDEEKNPWMKQFKKTLEDELAKLFQLHKESVIRKVADHEDEKNRIAEILERVNEARKLFQLGTDIAVFKMVQVIENDLKQFLADHLKVSYKADHKYYVAGSEEGLRRTVCSPGTRDRIRKTIVKWANDTSPESQGIYWLFGPAGSGKSSIAYTVARRFELTSDTDDTITLGGNFFCSRQFDETRGASHIIRTIVYHLSLKCKAFAESLRHSGKFDTVHQGPRAQLKDLLVGPWGKSEPVPDTSSPRRYLIVIDALDEIDQQGGSDFLRALLDVINEDGLPGLKFFVTSRSDPDLVSRVESFKRKQLYRLQDVEKEEVHADIKMYLEVSLPHFVGRIEMDKLLSFASGLFISAATLVRYFMNRTRREQEKFIGMYLSDTTARQTALDATELLDKLYLQILSDLFACFRGDAFANRLFILHTFLCTLNRTSTSTVAALLVSEDRDEIDTDMANGVLSLLYAVLYTDHNQHVLSYHKSFSDFLVDEHRSKEYWCNQAAHHRLLTESCFRVMNGGLKFNIASIPSSFIFDSDDQELLSRVEKSISPTLSYSSRNWSDHLSLMVPTTSNPDPVLAILEDFLQLRVLFWIEAMNLLNVRGFCDPILRAVSNWASKYQLSLARQLSEAASFALYFSGSPASSSTPHLYISSLATWPRGVEPVRAWRAHFPRIPGVFTNGDGRWIASGSSDNMVRVWDATTGQVQSVLEGHIGTVLSVAFSSDGTLIASGSDDKSVRVWDMATGKVRIVLEGHTDWVRSVAFSSDGTRIASASGDRSVRLWDMSTGMVQSILKDHTGEVNSVAFSSDGTRLASGSDDKSVRVWDISTGKVQSVLEGHTLTVCDGTHIASGSFDRSVQVWDMSMAKAQSMLDSDQDGSVFSADGTDVASGLNTTSVQVGDLHMFYKKEKVANPDGKLTPTGWLLSLTGKNRLIFVPVSIKLAMPTAILVLSSYPYSVVNLASAALGDQWHQIYTPVPQVTDGQ
ncbi:hypothetical protein EST38_g3197 [Candolleomyces aberdarensis]|uniref:NACHT domain-containing protein n=1 Tax=Candolleomyces aberdarensis TaxID=2316362 RepID=A0A4Q2DU51_9AGAR|nr:hypothetical protein EST38_g3197 [Candolleomyces aberdarensis]